ncbi:MAG: enoyl-CoA hydratase/isomerase family protein [Acidimicrobiia bacterium]
MGSTRDPGWRTTPYRNIALDEHDGVLEVRLHSDDGPLLWSSRVHAEIGDVAHQIAADPDLRAVVLTGTGDSFIADAYRPPAGRPAGDPGTTSTAWSSHLDATTWHPVGFHAERLLLGLLDIRVPVVAAVNGPATIHAELALLSDIVLCTPETVFQETHFSIGVVPGDGVHVVWPMLLGPARGRYHLYTGKQVTATQALDWGVVAEVVPAADLVDRAHALAAHIAARPPITVAHTRALLVDQMRRAMRDALPYGLALEGLGAGAHWPGVPERAPSDPG